MRSLVATVVVHVIALFLVAPVLALLMSPSSDTDAYVFTWAIVAGLLELTIAMIRSAGREAASRRRVVR